MRILFYLDPALEKEDPAFAEMLREELPQRAELLKEEYSATPWIGFFADSAFGTRSFKDLRRDITTHDEPVDAVVVIPNHKLIDEDHGLNSAAIIERSKYLEDINALVSDARDLDIPVLGYLDDAGPKAKFNMMSAGVAMVIDHADEPALLPLAVARLVYNNATTDGLVSFCGLSISTKDGRMSYEGKDVHLTGQQRQLLLSLLKHQGTPRTQQRLVGDIYDFKDDEPDAKIIDVYTTKLRSAINAAVPGLGFDMFRTRWGEGYYIANDIPQTREYFGILRLDEKDDGNFEIADTSLTMSAEEREVFLHLYNLNGLPAKLDSNFMSANFDHLQTLNALLGSCMLSQGSPVEIFPDSNEAKLNMSYFDPKLFDATDYSSFVKQDITLIGPHRFIRMRDSVQKYNLIGDTQETAFSVAEVRLLEALHRNKGQVVRADVLFNSIRGSNYALRGQVTPEEDVLNAARSLFKKLDESDMDIGQEDNVKIYHDILLSYGEAENVPTAEELEEQSKRNVARYTERKLETSSGSSVTLTTDTKFEYFDLRVHPVTGEAVVKDSGIELKHFELKMLESAFEKRPEPISFDELHRAAFPSRAFNQTTLSNKVNALRGKLKGVSEEAANLLFTVRGEGYACLLPGDPVPEVTKATENVPKAAIVSPDNELEVLELHGRLEVERDPKNQALRIRNTNIVLPQKHADALIYISEQFPIRVYETDLAQRFGINNLKNFVTKLEEHWTPEYSYFPLSLEGKGVVWQDIPTPTTERLSQMEESVFNFVAEEGYMFRCEKTDANFIPREVVLMSVLDENRGKLLDADAIRHLVAEKGDKLQWDDNTIRATFDNALGKINAASPETGSRVKVTSKGRETVYQIV